MYRAVAFSGLVGNELGKAGFTHHGVTGHEIVFAYPVRLEDARLYAAERLTIREDNGEVLAAGWFAIEALGPGRVALFPDGLLELLPGMGTVQARAG